jgi:hypothetical protein
MAKLDLNPVLDQIETDIALLSVCEASDLVKKALEHLGVAQVILTALRKDLGTLEISVEVP